MRICVFALALLFALASPLACANGGGSHGSRSAGVNSNAVPGVPQDAHGQFARDR